ncbi:MAG: hypothetical protein ACTSRG_09845 [Candidatus Helarchaeota archaeon]
MVLNYYMSRYSTDGLYTFEFVFCIFLFLILLLFWKLYDEKNSFKVYIITGLLHSSVELLGQGTGARKISITYLFGILKLSYPFTPFILGFFEGGFFCLVAYHVVRILMNQDEFSKKFTLVFSISVGISITLGGISIKQTLKSNPFSVIFTRRIIFSPSVLIVLLSFFILSFGYFFLRKNIPRDHKISFLYFYIGMIYVTALIIVPLHILGVRFIESYQNFIFSPASILEQILIMYGFNIGIESAGYFLPYYVIIYHYKLVDFHTKIK